MKTLNLALTVLFSITSLCFTTALTYADTPAGDGTPAMVQAFQTTYASKIVGTVESISLKGQLWVTTSAQKLMDAKQFDVEDPTFDQDVFQKFVSETFLWSLNYYSSVYGSQITEIHLALDDLGDDRQSTACETFVNTRFMHCDLRRVHKMYKGYRAYLLPLVLTHEFTHANQYLNLNYPTIQSSSSGPEGRALAHDRELKAITVEVTAIMQHDGQDIAFSNYNKMLKGACLPSTYTVDDETLLKQTGRRCLILTLWTLIETQLVETTQPSAPVNPFIPNNLS